MPDGFTLDEKFGRKGKRRKLAKRLVGARQDMPPGAVDPQPQVFSRYLESMSPARGGAEELEQMPRGPREPDVAAFDRDLQALMAESPESSELTPEQMQAAFDLLVSQGHNAIMGDKGVMDMGLAGTPEDRSVPNPFGTNPSTGLPYRQGLPTEQMRAFRARQGRDVWGGTISGLPATDYVNAAEVSKNNAAQRFADFYGGGDTGQEAGQPPGGDLVSMVVEGLTKRYGRPPSPDTILRFFQSLMGQAGGAR